MMTHFPNPQDADVGCWRRTQSPTSSHGLTLCPGQKEPKQKTIGRNGCCQEDTGQTGGKVLAALENRRYELL